MISPGIAVAVAVLAAGQLDLQLEPELVAEKQAAAKVLDDALVDRYVAFTREAVRTQPKGPFASEEAEERAMEGVTRAAAKKVGLPVEKVGGVSLLVQEWSQVSSPHAGPRGPELRAGFVKRYGSAAVAVLERNDGKLKKLMQELMESAARGARGP